MASRGRGGGFFIDIDGADEMIRSLNLALPQLQQMARNVARGEAGRSIVQMLKASVPVKTGELRSGIAMHDMGDSGGVKLGYIGALSRGNNGGGRFQKGTWVESGTKPHTIHDVKFNGRFYSEVHHPGQKGKGIARRTLYASRSTIERGMMLECQKMFESTS
jgi:hypothetical protein